MKKREAVRRIKMLLAEEMRQSISMHPQYLEDEPEIIQRLWEDTVWDIADRIATGNPWDDADAHQQSPAETKKCPSCGVGLTEADSTPCKDNPECTLLNRHEGGRNG